MTLTLSAIKSLDGMVIDFNNAYIFITCKEKIWLTLGSNFGNNKGKKTIILRDLDGLKSANRASRVFNCEWQNLKFKIENKITSTPPTVGFVMFLLCCFLFGCLLLPYYITLIVLDLSLCILHENNSKFSIKSHRNIYDWFSLRKYSIRWDDVLTLLFYAGQ